MGLGAFAPLPIRLGSDGGIAAADWLRAAADIDATRRAAPLMVCVVEWVSASTANVYNVTSRDPSKAAPSITPLPYGFTLRLPDYIDDAGTAHKVAPRMAIAWCETGGAPATAHPSVTGYDVTVALSSSAAVTYVYLAIFGDDEYEGEDGTAGYGAIADKRDVHTNEASPRAWQWWRTLKSLRGVGAYTQDVVSQLGIRDLAFARHCAWVGSLADKLIAEQLPETSYSRLGYWATVLGIEQRRNSEARVRDLCSARYQARQGPTSDVDDNVCARVFGSAFVRTWRTRPAINVEPVPTYWPGGDVGPSSYAIDAIGPWLSARSRVDVEVVRPAGLSDGDWTEITRDFEAQLSRILPAWVVFDWATELTGGGLILDETPLDEGGLG